MKELYATIDLGSNSFHLLIASLEHDELKVIESTSDKVMLADGLTKQQGIAADAMKRGIDCLTRYSQRLENISKDNIRIVGTNTLRAAVNSDRYVSQLENILQGIRIDIVSGIEEARLIYLGVNHSWSSSNNQKLNLVVDIGGGSTEFIIGRDFELTQTESLHMGCVAFRRFFVDGNISIQNFATAKKAAVFELSNIVSDFSKISWQQVIGSAGTFKAIERILVAQNLVKEGISLTGLKDLESQILNFSNIKEIKIKGLKTDRTSTIVAGVAIAISIFESLGIQNMLLARGGLREGVLYDLLGRHKKEDVRQRSINALCKRYNVSKQWRGLNKRIVTHLLETIQLPQKSTLSQENLKFLDWAVQSFRIGLAINHSQYHVHSAYLVEHSELSGFSIRDRKLLAGLLKNHRRKLELNLFDDKHLTAKEIQQYYLVVFLLRLTVIISQNGKANKVSHLSLIINEKKFVLLATNVWLVQNSLIQHAIEKEQKYWSKVGIELKLQSSDQ